MLLHTFYIRTYNTIAYHSYRTRKMYSDSRSETLRFRLRSHLWSKVEMGGLRKIDFETGFGSKNYDSGSDTSSPPNFRRQIQLQVWLRAHLCHAFTYILYRYISHHTEFEYSVFPKIQNQISIRICILSVCEMYSDSDPVRSVRLRAHLWSKVKIWSCGGGLQRWVRLQT